MIIEKDAGCAWEFFYLVLLSHPGSGFVDLIPVSKFFWILVLWLGEESEAGLESRFFVSSMHPISWAKEI